MTQAPLFPLDDEEAAQTPKQSEVEESITLHFEGRPVIQREDQSAQKKSVTWNSPADTGTLRTVEEYPPMGGPQAVSQDMTGVTQHPAPSGLMAGGPAPKPTDKPLRPGQKGYKPEPLPPGSCAGSLGWITLDFTGWADYPGTYTDVACQVCGIVFRVPYSVGTILDALAWAGRQSYSVPIHGAPQVEKGAE